MRKIHNNILETTASGDLYRLLKVMQEANEIACIRDIKSIILEQFLSREQQQALLPNIDFTVIHRVC
jgi:division protein CdvB (Snf7/Vps24/ESCRT-III family)